MSYGLNKMTDICCLPFYSPLDLFGQRKTYCVLSPQFSMGNCYSRHCREVSHAGWRVIDCALWISFLQQKTQTYPRPLLCQSSCNAKVKKISLHAIMNKIYISSLSWPKDMLPPHPILSPPPPISNNTYACQKCEYYT